MTDFLNKENSTPVSGVQAILNQRDLTEEERDKIKEETRTLKIKNNKDEIKYYITIYTGWVVAVGIGVYCCFFR